MGELYNPFPKLPKNIRQIGDRDPIVKLYVEDYVNTYLKRLYPVGGQDLRVGLLLGNIEVNDGTPYVFIDGAMEMEDVTEEGEKVVFSETAWKKAYRNIEEMFPKRTVQGWFLCGGAGCQLSPLNYWKQHGQYFSEKNKLMYLNSGLEGEESIYIASDDGFYKLKGHSIYYERNQIMQDYMVLRKDAKRVECGVSDPVIRNFRQKLGDRKVEVTATRNTIGLLGGLCSGLAIAILAGSIVMFNNYHKMKEMESAIASAFPKGINEWQDYKIESDAEVIVEEAKGEVYPTREQSTAYVSETLSGETASTEVDISETEAAVQSAPAPTEAEEMPIPTLAQADEEAAAIGESIAKQSVYVVGDGETLYSICFTRYHSVNMLKDICEMNGLEDENKIVTGQKLILP